MMKPTAAEIRKMRETEGVKKHVNYIRHPDLIQFETDKHNPFEIMCDKCYFMGETDNRQVIRQTTYLSLFCCTYGIWQIWR